MFRERRNVPCSRHRIIPLCRFDDTQKFTIIENNFAQSLEREAGTLTEETTNWLANWRKLASMRIAESLTDQIKSVRGGMQKYLLTTLNNFDYRTSNNFQLGQQRAYPSLEVDDFLNSIYKLSERWLPLGEKYSSTPFKTSAYSLSLVRALC